jgi:hypothetical protein
MFFEPAYLDKQEKLQRWRLRVRIGTNATGLNDL